MAITITAYNFSKRSNSTARPSGSGTDFSVLLKDRCSYDRPEFLINHSGTFTYNYIVWGAWCYFVTDVTIEANDLIKVSCDIDVLATYKTEIGNTSAFVLYDTAANTEIVDKRLSTKTTTKVTTIFGDNNIFEASQCIVVGIVGRTQAGLYAMTASQANELLNSINNWMDNTSLLPIPNIDISSFNDFLEATAECLSAIAHNITTGFRQLIATGKAPDSIKSAMLLPIDASEFQGSNETIYLGDYNTGITGYKLRPGAFASEFTTLSIPWEINDWRRNPPYSELYLYLPYCGLINIPTSSIINATTIYVTCFVSVNGAVTYEVNTDTNAIGRFGGNCGSNYMIGASNVTPFSSAGAVLAGIGGLGAIAATGGGAGAVAVGAGAITGQVHNLIPMPSSIGASGGGAYCSGYIITLYSVFHDTNVDPSTVSNAVGTPSYSVKQINTLSGYVQTQCFSVNAACEEPIRQRINTLMDGGVFYE